MHLLCQKEDKWYPIVFMEFIEVSGVDFESLEVKWVGHLRPNWGSNAMGGVHGSQVTVKKRYLKNRWYFILASYS